MQVLFNSNNQPQIPHYSLKLPPRTKEDSYILGQFLQEMRNGGQFAIEPGVKYSPKLIRINPTDEEKEFITVSLDFPIGSKIIIRPNKNRYKVLGPEINNGGMGKICSVVATLIMNEDFTVTYQPEDKWVAKFVRVPNATSLQRLIKEGILVEKINLGKKHTYQVDTLFPEQPVDVVLFMKKIPGEDLFTILTGDNLAAPVRFKIAQEITYRLKQLHIMGILHRDLKPENTMIEFTEGIYATLIDLGLARLLNEIDNLRAGTDRYQAPEIRDGKPSNESADIRSLGRTLKDLLIGFEDHDSFLLSAGYTPGEKKNIVQLVTAMMDDEPSKRPPIDEVISTFVNMLSDRQTETCEEDSKEKLEELISQAIAIRDHLFKLAKDNTLISFAGNLDNIKNLITTAFAPLPINDPDHTLAIQIFTEMLNVKAFKQCSNSDKIIDKIDQLVEHYHSSIAKTEAFQSFLTNFIENFENSYAKKLRTVAPKLIQTLQRLESDFNKILLKKSQFQLSLEDIIAFTEEVDTKILYYKNNLMDLLVFKAESMPIPNYLELYSSLVSELRNFTLPYLIKIQTGEAYKGFEFSGNNPDATPSHKEESSDEEDKNQFKKPEKLQRTFRFIGSAEFNKTQNNLDDFKSLNLKQEEEEEEEVNSTSENSKT